MRKGGAAALAALALAGAFFLAARAFPAAPGLTIEVLSDEADVPASGAGDAGDAQPDVSDISTGAPAETPAPEDGRPRVLVYHTHTWEAYEPTEEDAYTPTETWRTKDERFNMVRVGERLCEELEKQGFYAVQDRTAFEPPDLSDAYTRSLAMLEARMDAGERYDYVLDVHRDAYSGDWNGANAVTGEDGEKTAYVMLLVGKGTGAVGSGFDERPDWPKNLALAERLTNALNAISPGISREVKVKSGRFNQHVSAGALLIEIGNNKNTLAEALAACPAVAQALARVWAEDAEGGGTAQTEQTGETGEAEDGE